MKKFRVAAIGAGRATRELTIPAFRHVQGGVLVAVADIHIDAAQSVAKKHGLVAYSNIEEMIQKESVDVAIVNTPVATHAPVAIAAMHAGAHVIIEKPAVDTLSELDDIQRVSQETGKKVTVVHNYKYYQGPQKAFQMYRDGLLGDILHIDRVWMSPPQEDRMEMDQNGWWHNMPGGRLADALPHMLYIPYMFVGDMEFVSLAARKKSVDRPWSVCDEASVLLESKSGFVQIRESTNQESWLYKGYTYHTILYGTKLTVYCDHHHAEILAAPTLRRNAVRLKDAALEYVREYFSKDVVARGAHNVFYDKFFDYILDLGANPTPWKEVENVATLSEIIGRKMQTSIDTNVRSIL